jgi:hypothetical protein
LALGHLRIDPWDWPKWTIREFDIAYDGWSQINIRDKWERVRALSFYSMVPHLKQGTLKNWKDVFSVDWDKKVKKQKPVIIRPMTDEEKKEFEFIINNAIKVNG